MLKSRIAALSPEEQEEFLPLSPDFVVELRSRSDRLPDLQEKLREYIDNGTRLGWLIDPKDRRAYVYRPGHAVVILENPAKLSGDPEFRASSWTLRTCGRPGECFRNRP